MTTRENGDLRTLMGRVARDGRVQWIGVRPGRREPMTHVDDVQARPGVGLVGDRYSGRSGKREVTLVQAEHLPVIAACLGVAEVHPHRLRRNIAISGINLAALKGRRFRIGSAVFEHTGPCHPCSRMEEALGHGGYNAVRGHGGITARVVEAGVIRIGDALSPLEAASVVRP